MTTEEKLDHQAIFEHAMRQLGWRDALECRTDEGYADGQLQWAWIAWRVARNATLLQVALWYKDRGYLLDEDDIPQAILDFSEPT